MFEIVNNFDYYYYSRTIAECSILNKSTLWAHNRSFLMVMFQTKLNAGEEKKMKERFFFSWMIFEWDYPVKSSLSKNNSLFDVSHANEIECLHNTYLLLILHNLVVDIVVNFVCFSLANEFLSYEFHVNNWWILVCKKIFISMKVRKNCFNLISTIFLT